MGYFAAYWGQIKGFYRTIWYALFAKDRELEGPLSRFITKKGFVWELAEMHWWLVRLVGRFVLTLCHIFFGYIAMLIIFLVLLLAPFIILLAFPVFTMKRRARLRMRGREL